VLGALKSNSALKEEKIKIKVEDGNVFLEGELESEIEICSVIDSITLIHKTRPSDIQKKINAAFHRSAAIDSGRITAEVIGTNT